jgi:hypothetical protein
MIMRDALFFIIPLIATFAGTWGLLRLLGLA